MQLQGLMGQFMSITLTITDDLARQLKPYESQFDEIVEIGLRELRSREEPGYVGIDDILEKLATLPTPEEVLALRPSPGLQNRLDTLLEKNCKSGFTPEEHREWERYEYAEHLVRMAKIHATIKLQRNGS